MTSEEEETTAGTTTPAGDTLEATLPDGQAVETPASGTCTIDGDDQAGAHCLHVPGSGLEAGPGVSETGTSTWIGMFEAGSYHFRCDPRSGSANGDLEVTG